MPTFKVQSTPGVVALIVAMLAIPGPLAEAAGGWQEEDERDWRSVPHRRPHELPTDPAEGRVTVVRSQPPDPKLAAPLMTVGNGCMFSTIASAIGAASPDSIISIEGGREFHENLVIDKNLTLIGGYDGCATGSTETTIIHGQNLDRVIDIAGGIDVELQNICVRNGTTSHEGGGIKFAPSGGGTLTLTDVAVYFSHAEWGGGIWIGPGAQLVSSDLRVNNNTAAVYGGGLRLMGGGATFDDGSFVHNEAPRGAAVYATMQTANAPFLSLKNDVSLFFNEALSGDGLGGAIYMSDGELFADWETRIFDNEAFSGGGVYLVRSTFSNGVVFEDNLANDNGGAIYAEDSTIELTDGPAVAANEAGVDGTGLGGGAYLDGSSLLIKDGMYSYNTAPSGGGGVYAVNSSTVELTRGPFICRWQGCREMAGNIAAGGQGGAIRAQSSAVTIDGFLVVSNTALAGGGIYAVDSDVTVKNAGFSGNDSTGTLADAVRLFDGSTLTGVGSTFGFNDDLSAATGKAIGISGSLLVLEGSIIWGHATSIDQTGHLVTCSDIEGGYSGTDNDSVDPLFESEWDLTLQEGSPVIDRCASMGGETVDREYDTRAHVVVNDMTPYDMGCDEYGAPSALIFADGFDETGDTTNWSSSSP